MNEQLPATNYAVNRIDRLTGRVFTAASMIAFAETVWNAVSQAPHLNAVWLYTAVGILSLAQLANLVNFWLLKGRRYFYLLHGAAYLIAFATWPLQADDLSQIQPGFKPWLWWATSAAAMAVGMYSPRWWAIAYVLFVPTSWSILHSLPVGGSANLQATVTDGFYSALFPATIVALVLMVRQAARRADQASDNSLRTQMESVARETEVRERVRTDSSIYAGVFEALKSVAKAKNSADYETSVALAQHALDRIERLELSDSGEVSTLALFDTLEVLARRLDPECEINVTGSSLNYIPGAVANAVSDAVLQALLNSLQHAGPSARRKLRLKGTRAGIKVVVQDDGVGFWPSKIPSKSRGFRYLILRRVTEIGGTVHIDAAPGKGANIVIEWEVAA